MTTLRRIWFFLGFYFSPRLWPPRLRMPGYYGQPVSARLAWTLAGGWCRRNG